MKHALILLILITASIARADRLRLVVNVATWDNPPLGDKQKIVNMLNTFVSPVDRGTYPNRCVIYFANPTVRSIADPSTQFYMAEYDRTQLEQADKINQAKITALMGTLQDQETVFEFCATGGRVAWLAARGLELIPEDPPE